MLMYNGLKLDRVKGLVVEQSVFNNYTERYLMTLISNEFKISNLDYVLETSQVGVFENDIIAWKAYTNNKKAIIDSSFVLTDLDNFANIKLNDNDKLLIYIKE